MSSPESNRTSCRVSRKDDFMHLGHVQGLDCRCDSSGTTGFGSSLGFEIWRAWGALVNQHESKQELRSVQCFRCSPRVERALGNAPTQ